MSSQATAPALWKRGRMADAEHGLDIILKDVRKNIEKGLATAKVEWEDALKRGQKPLEQVQRRSRTTRELAAAHPPSPRARRVGRRPVGALSGVLLTSWRGLVRRPGAPTGAAARATEAAHEHRARRPLQRRAAGAAESQLRCWCRPTLRAVARLG